MIINKTLKDFDEIVKNKLGKQYLLLASWPNFQYASLEVELSTSAQA